MNVRLPVLSLLGSLALVAACGNGTNGTDSGTDVVATDNGSGDTGNADAGNADTGGDTGVVPTDAQPDAPSGDGGGPACTGTISPLHYWQWHNVVNMTQHDATAVGMSDHLPDPDVIAKPGDFVNPDATVGNCVFYAQPTTGSASRNAMNTLNYGTVTVMQGDRSLVFTYDSTMHSYSADTSQATPLLGNVATTVSVAGGPDGPMGMAMLDFPPVIHFADIASPPTALSRTTDTTFNFTPPAGLRDGDAALLIVASLADTSHVIACTVPASCGRLTLPAAIVQNIDAGTSVQWALEIARLTTVPPETRPLDFRLASSVIFVGNVE